MPSHKVVVALVLIAAACASVTASAQREEFGPLEPTRPSNASRHTPTLQTIVQPISTPAALQARIEGDVSVEVTVAPDGTVADARVTSSLDRQYGLDDQALAAARQWRFSGGGRPAPVVLHLALQFRLPEESSTAMAEFARGAARDDAPGLVKPAVVTERAPSYTAEAIRARLQGTVDVRVVVGPDGSVTGARLARTAWASSAGPDGVRAAAGLVENALEAARSWRFTPGSLNGVPAPVLATVTLRFRVH